jgi:hypothetical protein
MAPGLQKQRIGDDGDDSSQRGCSRNRILRAVKQDAHDQPALGLSRDRNRRGTTATRLHFIC